MIRTDVVPMVHAGQLREVRQPAALQQLAKSCSRRRRMAPPRRQRQLLVANQRAAAGSRRMLGSTLLARRQASSCLGRFGAPPLPSGRQLAWTGRQLVWTGWLQGLGWGRQVLCLERFSLYSKQLQLKASCILRQPKT